MTIVCWISKIHAHMYACMYALKMTCYLLLNKWKVEAKHKVKASPAHPGDEDYSSECKKPLTNEDIQTMILEFTSYGSKGEHSKR